MVTTVFTVFTRPTQLHSVNTVNTSFGFWDGVHRPVETEERDKVVDLEQYRKRRVA